MSPKPGGTSERQSTPRSGSTDPLRGGKVPALGQESHRKAPMSKLKLPATPGDKASKGGQASQRKSGPLGGLKIPSGSKADGGPSSQRGTNPFAAGSGSGSSRSTGSDGITLPKAESQLSNRARAAPKLKLPDGAAPTGASQASNRKAATGSTSNRKAGAKGSSSDRKAAGASSNRKGGKASSAKKRKAAGAPSAAGVEGDDNLEELDDVEEGVEETGLLSERAANPLWDAMNAGPAGDPLSLPAPVPAYMHDQLQAAIKAGDNDLVEELLDCLRELAKVDGVSDLLGEGEEGAGGAHRHGPPPDPPQAVHAAGSASGGGAIQKWASISLDIDDTGRATVQIRIDDPAERAAAAALALAPAPPSSSAVVPISKDEAARLLAGLLVEALHRPYARIIELFQQWDADADGCVSKVEFRNALPLLQLNGDVSLAEVDALFDSFDVDGSGAITYKELLAELDAVPKASPRAASGQAGAKAATQAAAPAPAARAKASGASGTPSGTPRRTTATPKASPRVSTPQGEKKGGATTPRGRTKKASSTPRGKPVGTTAAAATTSGDAFLAATTAATGVVAAATGGLMHAAGAAAAAISNKFATLHFSFDPSGKVSLGIDYPGNTPSAATAADATVPKLAIPERSPEELYEDRTRGAIMIQRIQRGKSSRAEVARRRQATTADVTDVAVPKLSIPERMALEDRTNGAIMIQRVQRGKSSRFEVQRRRQATTADVTDVAVPKLSIPERMALEDRTNGAIMIQRVQRGKSSRFEAQRRRVGRQETMKLSVTDVPPAAKAAQEEQGLTSNSASAGQSGPFQVNLDVDSNGGIAVNIAVFDGQAPASAAPSSAAELAIPPKVVEAPSAKGSRVVASVGGPYAVDLSVDALGELSLKIFRNASGS